jgi:hypothetical protein
MELTTPIIITCVILAIFSFIVSFFTIKRYTMVERGINIISSIIIGLFVGSGIALIIWFIP